MESLLKRFTHRGRHLHIRVDGNLTDLSSAEELAAAHILKFGAAPPPGVREAESYHAATPHEAKALAWHETGHAEKDDEGGWLHFRVEKEGPNGEPIVYPSYEMDKTKKRTNAQSMLIAIGRGRKHMSTQDKRLFKMFATRRKFLHEE